MKNSEIKNLLDKYMAGETSLDEEKLLREYFEKADVHKDFEAFKPMFNYFSSKKKLVTSEDFEKKILSKIKEEKQPAKTYKLYWLKIAAIILIAIGATGIIYKSLENKNNSSRQAVVQTQISPNNSIQITDTYTNPEDAKKAVEQALAMLSKHLNKGKNIADKNIGKMDVLNKALNN